MPNEAHIWLHISHQWFWDVNISHLFYMGGSWINLRWGEAFRVIQSNTDLWCGEVYPKGWLCQVRKKVTEQFLRNVPLCAKMSKFNFWGNDSIERKIIVHPNGTYEHLFRKFKKSSWTVTEIMLHPTHGGHDIMPTSVHYNIELKMPNWRPSRALDTHGTIHTEPNCHTR